MKNEDRRTTPRTEIRTRAILQTLGPTADGNGHPMVVQVLDVGDRGLRLEADTPLPVGQAVKIEVGDSMFLGEICHCESATDAGEPRFHLGVFAKECLKGLGGLLHLIEALTPDSMHELEQRR